MLEHPFKSLSCFGPGQQLGGDGLGELAESDVEKFLVVVEIAGASAKFGDRLGAGIGGDVAGGAGSHRGGGVDQHDGGKAP